MSTQDDPQKTDKATDALFDAWYEAALLEESFQQQRIADIEQLPTKHPLLNSTEQAFTHEKQLSPAFMQQLMSEIEHNRAKPSLWKRLFFSQKTKTKTTTKANFSLFSPMITLPTTLAFGILFGVLFAPLLTTPTAIDGQFRGVETTQQPMEDNPRRWLDYIASLIESGELTLAEQELARFKQRYPDFESFE